MCILIGRYLFRISLDCHIYVGINHLLKCSDTAYIDRKLHILCVIYPLVPLIWHRMICRQKNIKINFLSANVRWPTDGKKRVRQNEIHCMKSFSNDCAVVCVGHLSIKLLDSKNWLRNKDKLNILFATHKINQFEIIITSCAPKANFSILYLFGLIMICCSWVVGNTFELLLSIVYIELLFVFCICQACNTSLLLRSGTDTI